MIHVCTTEQDWLTRRATGVTASDIALIMGNEIAREQDEKYHGGACLRGLADKKRGPIEAERGSLSMRCGSAIEPLIVERFNEEHPELMAIRPTSRWTLYERDGWMLATPDALVHAYVNSEAADIVGLLECKWTAYWMHDQSKLARYLEYYQWQCRWQMAVTGAKQCWLRWILRYPKADNEEGEHLFERDMAIEKAMIEKARCFHEQVVSGEPIDEGKIYAGF